MADDRDDDDVDELAEELARLTEDATESEREVAKVLASRLRAPGRGDDEEAETQRLARLREELEALAEQIPNTEGEMDDVYAAIGKSAAERAKQQPEAIEPDDDWGPVN